MTTAALSDDEVVEIAKALPGLSYRTVRIVEAALLAKLRGMDGEQKGVLTRLTILRILEAHGGQMTATEIASKSGRDRSTISRRISKMLAENNREVRISGWRPAEFMGKQAAEYSIGNGKDANRPIYSEAKSRRRRRELTKVVHEARKRGPASPFDGLGEWRQNPSQWHP